MIHFVTAADKEYFGRLGGLIGSIHRHCKQDFTISVYDLGLLPEEVELVSKVRNVTIKQVEKTNPSILTKMQTHPHAPECDQLVTGLYSWKPVVIKQELDLYDAIIYMDAGTMLVNNPEGLWDYINVMGYWFLGINDIDYMTTDYVKKKLNVIPEVLTLQGINAGIQGLTRWVYDGYVLPMYEYSKDINLFIDDGTCYGGKTAGRHDQTLFSIQARSTNLAPTTEFHVVDNRSEITNETVICHCRGNSDIVDLKTLW